MKSAFRYNGNDLIKKVRALLKAADLAFDRVYLIKRRVHGLHYDVTIRIEQPQEVDGLTLVQAIRKDFFDWLSSGIEHNLGVVETRGYSNGQPVKERMSYHVQSLQATLW